jgi:hypothetical protein
MTVKIPNRVFRAVIAVAAVAILSVSGTGWAAAGDPVPDPDAVPAPYPGGSVVLPISPAPTLAGDCQPRADGDDPHLSSGDISAHGWWYRGTCPNTKATVDVRLFEYYSDGTWRLKAENWGSVWPGGGSGNRVTARRTCESTLGAGWATSVYVSIGTGDSYYSPAVNRSCQVYT